MTQRVYLDTSIFSVLVDDRTPERQQLTLEFWAKRSAFELSTSEVARLEAVRTTHAVRREAMLACLAEVTVHAINEKMRDFARKYIDQGIFTINALNDALHVAAAVTTRQDVLLSWNFKHLVNRQRRAAINSVNLAAGLPTIDIIAPPEL